MATGKKRGPKTDNPKPYKIGVKLDQEAKDILDAYCEQEAALLQQSSSHFPTPQPSKKMSQRKYYIMRCDFFQGGCKTFERKISYDEQRSME